MPKKLYSISELINENIKLKKKVEKVEVEHLKSLLTILVLLRDHPQSLDLDKIILGFEFELKRLKNE